MTATHIYGMIDSYRSKDLGTGYRIKIGESYQPRERSRQVHASLIHHTPERVALCWERIGHLLAVYEFGQNVGAYGTEYFGKFRSYDDAKKALDRFWKKFEELRNGRADCPYCEDLLACKVCEAGSWGRAIRKYRAGFTKARNTKFPYGLRPYMPMDNWQKKLFA